MVATLTAARNEHELSEEPPSPPSASLEPKPQPAGYACTALVL